MSAKRHSVVAHFFGGPKDGEVLEVENAPLKLSYPMLMNPLDVLAPLGRLVYVRRGECLGANAFYDYDDALTSS